VLLNIFVETFFDIDRTTKRKHGGTYAGLMSFAPVGGVFQHMSSLSLLRKSSLTAHFFL